MLYEYKCGSCKTTWEVKRPLAEWDKTSQCQCGSEGRRILSALPSYFNRTHPDIKQDIHELVAGEPPSNITEL